MPTYDSVRFSPAAPVALIGLRDTSGSRVVSDVPMLLDTGADITLLPSGAVNQLAVPLDPAQIYELMGFDGARSKAQAVHLDLMLLGLTFRGRFLLIDQPEGVLGRDILNHLNVGLNGPRLVWEVIRG